MATSAEVTTEKLEYDFYDRFVCDALFLTVRTSLFCSVRGRRLWLTSAVTWVGCSSNLESFFVESGSMEEEINRMERISLSELEKQEIEIPEGVWKTGSNPFDKVVVGRLLSGTRYNFVAFKETMLNAFKPSKRVDFEKLDNGRFLLNFERQSDLDRVMGGGPWCFDNDLLVLKLLHENDDPLSVPLLWVEFYVLARGLPLSKMNEDMASFIGNSLGSYRSVDLARNGVSGGSTLRIRVALDVNKPLRRLSSFKAGPNSFKITYSYERLPNFCYICGVMGHVFNFCESLLKNDFIDPKKELPFGPFLRAQFKTNFSNRSSRRGLDAFSPHQLSPSRSSQVASWRKQGDFPKPRHSPPSRSHVYRPSFSDNSKKLRPNVSPCKSGSYNQSNKGRDEGTSSPTAIAMAWDKGGPSGASPPNGQNALPMGTIVPMIVSPSRVANQPDLDTILSSPRASLVQAYTILSPSGETQAIQVVVQSPRPPASQRRLFQEQDRDDNHNNGLSIPHPSPILINIPIQFAQPLHIHTDRVMKDKIRRPSEAEFRDEIKEEMKILLRFLEENNAPFVVEFFPLSFVTINNYDPSFAFSDNKSTYTVTDINGFLYTNAFDFLYDSFVWALRKAGVPDVKIVVGQIGWPTDGYPGANVSTAQRFYKSLLPFVASNKGTPMRPGAPIDINVHAWMDENKMPYNYYPFARHWGIFRTNGEPKFKIDLAGQGRDIYPTRAVGIMRMPGRWCVFNGESEDTEKVTQLFNYACKKSDCTSLVPGGSCSHLNFARNISYSFNMYFQFHFQAEEACEFEGFGEVVTDDPSSGGCVFPLEVVRGEQDQSGDNSSGVQEVPKCAMFLYLLSILWALLL
ncbi:hypothetical protein BUALT_Bualt08G0006500 [Buddleja alternifolia]|uniref:X8 domain-containing protein n=1 Tax=Buddleja alternifolia TaxID=168488 RepID=A0AAV6XDM2_9LAMI|nr:hypothetical protein BUALT_Bualt08G0006500 [Buddleja alternifolia]